MTWAEAAAIALALPGTERSTHYRQPAVQANGNAFLNAGNESETSFCLHLDPGLIDMLMATHPETFFQTPHYRGYPAVLVRFDTSDDALVTEMIGRAWDRARAKPAPKPRKR